MTCEARINSVKPVPGQRALQVEFANGKRYDVDLQAHIRQFPVLKPLVDPSLFGTAQAGEWGFDVRWGDGLELAAGTLHRLALGQTGEVANRHLSAGCRTTSPADDPDPATG
ncbi:DUF2442 domain-containing protein [Pseudomonas thivervalensis]|uniref:DUF2442 domain-containing protein n=1 Tax=Pseudomonas thivervalensis TaxID=86265 RepID=UPI00069D00EE|nr:DUF2442 domain-containing protein [Pseudomonas thivervalensis]